MSEATEQNGFSRMLGHLENIMMVFSGLSIAAIMLVVVSDVAMRYIFQQPLGWSYDLIGSYLMICVFFFALSDTLHSHSHIAIDVFAHKLPRRFEHLSLTIGYAASTAILLMIAWQGWDRCQAAFAANNMISTTVPWPTWPSYFMVAVGSAVLSLRCIVRSIGHGASFVTGRDLADLPPPPVTSSDNAEAQL
ncbi:TRAP transporter small permease [Sulfitobacter sp. F26169L]|uniref:TRAP transporter small permease n=1 Tax=Sulfitobacter sp. F26169L TaxID=2996015 RepID=UPI002260D56A|nr:TRAP transporter small permease [Sulfitobacter sp. F26169L]MCX7568087.1 TRAP transporter small permease [Sulfitobacter sp. F26169L]